MKNVKLPGVATNNSHIVMYNKMSNSDTSLARSFQKHLLDPTRAHGFIDHGKYSKRASKRKWRECEYRGRDSKDVQYK